MDLSDRSPPHRNPSSFRKKSCFTATLDFLISYKIILVNFQTLLFVFKEMFSGVSKIAQKRKMSAIKPDDLRLSPRTQMVEREDQYL